MLDYLLPIEYMVEQLMLGHMFNIVNGNAPTYLISGINMNQLRYRHMYVLNFNDRVFFAHFFPYFIR